MCQKALTLLFLISVDLYASDEPDRRVLQAAEFLARPDLAAHKGQAVMLNRFVPASDSEPVVRYELESGAHSFCLNGGDDYFTGLVVRAGNGEEMVRMRRSEHCRSLKLRSGTYTIQVLHSNSLPDPEKLTLLGVDEPGPYLHDANGNPLGGYWGIAAGTGQALISSPPPRNLGGIYTNDMPLIFNPRGLFWTGESLFNFSGAGAPTPLTPAGFFLDMTYDMPSWDSNLVVVSGDHDCNQRPNTCNLFDPQVGQHRKLRINDAGEYWFTLSWPNSPDLFFSIQNSAFSPNTLKGNTDGSEGSQFQVVFRYYADGSQIGPLSEGEAAIYESCNFQGQGLAFADTFDPDRYALDGSNWYNTFTSVRFGNNTSVQFSLFSFTANPPTQVVNVLSDTGCLPGFVQGVLGVFPLDTLLSSLGSTNLPCPHCQLVNTSFSRVNVQGADWNLADMSGATLTNVQFSANTNLNGAKFVKSTLSNVSFAGASLQNADFTGSTLNCVDMSGTATQIRDLNALRLKGVIWTTGNTCRNNLSYTRLSMEILPLALWKNTILTGAIFVDLPSRVVLSTQANPLDLTGAELGGINFRSAVLDYAIMPAANLTGAHLNSCSLRHAQLSGAKLYGTNLQNANLDGADMSKAFLNAIDPTGAAKLGGAFLRNVNLSGAQLSGADFTNASFFGTIASGLSTCAIVPGTPQQCASAAGATINNTEFSGAFLYGVDFSGATIQGVHFGNAVLIGANFDSAIVTNDVSLGTDSGFPSAFLQGTNLATARQLSNLSLLSAYLDFSAQGNAFTMSLSGDHTVFPGWRNQGQPECVQMSYGNGSEVPTNNSTMTCPDGSSSASGCGPTTAQNTAWESRVNISAIGTYEFDATYTPAAQNQFCTPDSNWFYGGLGSDKKQ